MLVPKECWSTGVMLPSPVTNVVCTGFGMAMLNNAAKMTALRWFTFRPYGWLI